MARAIYYPPANRTAQWWEGNFDRATMPTVDKLLLHTTETSSWPAYDAGAKAPTLTYHPWLKTGRWRQHNQLNTSARALQDPSSTPVRENRDNVVQVEIIAYCNPVSYKKYGFGVNALPDSAYEDLGDLLAFLHAEWTVPLIRAPKWSTFPPPDSIRMSSATYDAFKGVLGHQHASGNTHGDPGMTNAQVDRILAAAKPLTPPTTAKDVIDMATPAEVADAVELGIRNYMKDFFTDERGTGDSLADAAAERGQAQLAKLDQLIASVDKLTAALTPKG